MTDVNEMIDVLAKNAQKALEEYMLLNQEQIDKIEWVDLRYANGLAVAWHAPTESETTAVVAQ